MKSWIAWCMVVVAIGAWAGFGGLIWQLSRERVAFAEAEELAKQEALRGESSVRLRASVQDTEAERAALENLVGGTILQAVEVIEQSGKQAGASDVSIGGATPASNMNENLSAVSVVVNAKGSFVALMRAASLFETLPIPAMLERFELEKVEEPETTWLLTARIRVYTAPTP